MLDLVLATVIVFPPAGCLSFPFLSLVLTASEPVILSERAKRARAKDLLLGPRRDRGARKTIPRGGAAGAGG
jgi:hypothetical protein